MMISFLFDKERMKRRFSQPIFFPLKNYKAFLTWSFIFNALAKEVFHDSQRYRL